MLVVEVDVIRKRVYAKVPKNKNLLLVVVEVDAIIRREYKVLKKKNLLVIEVEVDTGERSSKPASRPSGREYKSTKVVVQLAGTCSGRGEVREIQQADQSAMKRM